MWTRSICKHFLSTLWSVKLSICMLYVEPFELFSALMKHVNLYPFLLNKRPLVHFRMVRAVAVLCLCLIIAFIVLAVRADEECGVDLWDSVAVSS